MVNQSSQTVGVKPPVTPPVFKATNPAQAALEKYQPTIKVSVPPANDQFVMTSQTAKEVATTASQPKVAERVAAQTLFQAPQGTAFVLPNFTHRPNNTLTADAIKGSSDNTGSDSNNSGGNSRRNG